VAGSEEESGTVRQKDWNGVKRVRFMFGIRDLVVIRLDVNTYHPASWGNLEFDKH
jgi:hypothetical protein